MKYYFKTTPQLDKVSSPSDKYEALRFNIINRFVSKTTAAASKTFRRCTNRSDFQEDRRWLSEGSSLHKNTLQLCGRFGQSNASSPHIRVYRRLLWYGSTENPEAFVHNSRSQTMRGKHLGYKNRDSQSALTRERWATDKSGDGHTDGMGSKVTVQQQRRRQMEALERHRASERAFQTTTHTRAPTHTRGGGQLTKGQTSIKQVNVAKVVRSYSTAKAEFPVTGQKQDLKCNLVSKKMFGQNCKWHQMATHPHTHTHTHCIKMTFSMY